MRTPSDVVQKRICCSTMVERHSLECIVSLAPDLQANKRRLGATGPSAVLEPPLPGDLVGGVRRLIDETQFRRQRGRDFVVRVPARFQLVFETVFDHRSGAGDGEAAMAEVSMRLDFELQTATAERER